jgi:hypothetical protein
MLARTEVQMPPLIGHRYARIVRRKNSPELTCFLSNNHLTGLPHRPLLATGIFGFSRLSSKTLSG